MFSFIKSYTQMFMKLSLFRNKRERKHRVPDTYVNIDYYAANVTRG